MNKRILGIGLAVTMMTGFAARSYAGVPTSVFVPPVGQLPSGPTLPGGGTVECLPAGAIAVAVMAYDYYKSGWRGPGPVIDPGPMFGATAFDP